MTKRILEILDNVRYWDTCPEDYKKDIETFLEEKKQKRSDAIPYDSLSDSFKQIIDNIDKQKKTVKCLHCGRKFITKLAHKCLHGYRKRHHKWEIIK